VAVSRRVGTRDPSFSKIQSLSNTLTGPGQIYFRSHNRRKKQERRIYMKNMIIITGLAVTFGLGMNAAGQSPAAQQGAPTVKTGSALKAKAASPAPSATAKNQSQKTSVGKGKATAKAHTPSSYWTEEVDLHDDGSVETTEFLYDAQRGIVYAYGEDDFTCANGKPERAGILEAVYAAGNKGGKPVGSGYYVVGLNAGQCAAKKAGGYGCKFDADGNPTECGVVAVNDATGEVTVAVVN
jgi:hypothetical protein